MDCFGTYFTHAQTCNVTRVQVLRNGLLRYILCTCPNLKCNPCSKCYGMDCFGTYFTHAQTCNVTRVQSATEWTASVHTLHMPKPNVTRVQSGTQWCASVIHMPKCVVTIVFKRLRHGVVRSILYTCPNHATPCCSLFVIHAFILCHS